MTVAVRTIPKLLWLLVPAAGLYLYRLESAPVYLYNTEVLFSLQAHAIASSARDLDGRLLPLYFQMRPIGDNVWFQPMLVYFTALVLEILPMSETVVRLPTVMVGLTNIVLMYWVAKRIFKRELLALIAAALLALTPAHLMTSRFAMDYLYPVPFVLAWLLCFSAFLERGRLSHLFAATSLLGIGFYSYIASVVMMPFYLLLTCLALLRERHISVKPYAVALAGFVWPLSPLLFWLRAHPAYSDTVGRYGFLHSLRDALHFFAITDRVNVYWSFLNPSYLFLTGGVDVMDSTRRVGVFLIPLSVLFLVGINRVVNVRRSSIGLIVLIGFLFAPLAAMIPAEAYAIDRELEVLPFGVLLAMFGIECLLSAPAKKWRMACLGLLGLVPLQFGIFYRDYQGDYRARSAGMYGGNLRGAIEEIIAQDDRQPAPSIYLSNDIAYVDSYWKFYLMKYGRQNLIGRTTRVNPAEVHIRAMPVNALVLLPTQYESGSLSKSNDLRTLKLIAEPDGSVMFAVRQR